MSTTVRGLLYCSDRLTRVEVEVPDNESKTFDLHPKGEVVLYVADQTTLDQMAHLEVVITNNNLLGSTEILDIPAQGPFEQSLAISSKRFFAADQENICVVGPTIDGETAVVVLTHVGASVESM